MNDISDQLERFIRISENPHSQLDRLLASGRKVIGCFPYYAPEELIYGAGMVSFGIWGTRGTIQAAKEYFASFYCTIAQMGLELSLKGTLKDLSGVMIPSLCDTLRPLTQNFRAANPDMPFLFLAHPQNRRLECGVKYTMSEYRRLFAQLCGIAGKPETEEDLWDAIRLCNENRRQRREFVKLAGLHPEAVSAKARSAVLKSAWFMGKQEYNQLLSALNKDLASLPETAWDGTKVVVSGIINDNPGLLEIFDKNKIAVVADDVAHESRAIRVDVAGTGGDPIEAVAKQFSEQDFDPLLYDPELVKRPAYVVDLARQNGADGVIIIMMQFCDPEELEYPSLKKALDEAGFPSLVIGFDHQMVDFGQAETALQSFAEMLHA